MTQKTTFEKLFSLSDQGRAQVEAFIDNLASARVQGWQFRTLADAYKPRPALEYVVPGLFSASSVNIVYGPPGSLKSMFMAEMCVCVAAGVPWLPPLHPGDNTERKPLQCPVLWCDFDNGMRRTDERMEAIGKARKLPDTIPLHYVSMPDPWLDLNAPGAVEFVVNYVNHFKARLLVIDNLGTVKGAADENSGQMIQVMSRARQIAEKSDAAAILIHHQRKSNGAKGRQGDTLRGHSSIEAAIDLALLIQREELSDTVEVKSTKTRGPEVLPFGAQFTYSHKPGTNDLAEVKFFGLPIADTKSDKAIHQAIIQALSGGPLCKTLLVNAVKKLLPDAGVNRIRSQIDYMERSLAIECTIEPKNNTHRYSLPVK